MNRPRRSRDRRRRTSVEVEAPDLTPMTEQEREAGRMALSRLVADLLADEDFIAFAATHPTSPQEPAPTAADPDRDFPSNVESS